MSLAAAAGAAKRYQRALQIKDAVMRALGSGRAQPASLLALVAAADRPVGRAALHLLHRARNAGADTSAFDVLDQQSGGAATRLAGARDGDDCRRAPISAALCAALARLSGGAVDGGVHEAALWRTA